MASQKNEMKKFGLVGKNIDYSFSRGYFADKFKKNGLLDCSYENFDLKEIEGIKSVFKTHGLNGLNVTIPYKKEVLPFMDKLSPQSKKIGAVNTIAFNENGETTGHNTDAYGFQKSLLEITEKLPVSALILGTGGASAAIAFALEALKIQFNFVSRNPKQGQLSYEAVDTEILKHNHLIINTSPVGTFPNTDKCPSIPYNELNASHTLFDLIYNPLETLFLRKGKEIGCTVSNGLKMLEFQAEKSWEIWNE